MGSAGGLPREAGGVWQGGRRLAEPSRAIAPLLPCWGPFRGHPGLVVHAQALRGVVPPLAQCPSTFSPVPLAQTLTGISGGSFWNF